MELQDFPHGACQGIILSSNNLLSVRLSQWFREEIFSVAIHPAGLYIAAGFADKIRLLNILIDDMRVFQEFAVRECR